MPDKFGRYLRGNGKVQRYDERWLRLIALRHDGSKPKAKPFAVDKNTDQAVIAAADMCEYAHLPGSITVQKKNSSSFKMEVRDRESAAAVAGMRRAPC
ncbi:hypothetical protein [Mesorhizobium onobrychidis]|uniref:Uncharacterized protein n=1 Tax=Mesorhizobium onobrychidis TaxID=2775404 RepID=A0ABY5R6K1_9HYPH|nr:hypothetical protein [Mesorhizobium onobrychidis]UVC17999.1 hypothetical protein IHQ72_13470 [Mesorhizobium onobrychidis]